MPTPTLPSNSPLPAGVTVAFGYARVSTLGQDLEAQRQRLVDAGCTRIFEEKVSGARRDRSELLRLLDYLRPGDVVIVTRLDRLARSTRDLIDIAERLRVAGAGLKSLAEPWADTTTPAGRMVLTVFAGIADFERSLILERTGAGRAHARAKGVVFGRKPKLDVEQMALAERLLRQGNSVPVVSRLMNIHRSTLYRALQRRDITLPLS